MGKEWLQVEISKELKHEFKVKVTQKRLNMTAVLQSLLELYNAGELDTALAKKTAHAEPEKEAVV